MASNECVQALRDREWVVQRYTGRENNKLIAAAMDRYAISSGSLDHKCGKFTNKAIAFHVSQTIIGRLEVVKIAIEQSVGRIAQAYPPQRILQKLLTF